MGRLTSELVISLIDRVTAPSRGIAAAMTNLQSRIADNNRRMEAMRGRLVETAAAGYGLYRALSAPINAATDFAARMEDVGQKAGIAQSRLGEVGKAIREIGLATGQGATATAKSIDFLMGMGASEDQSLAVAKPIGQAATAYRAATEELSAATFAAMDNLKVPAEQAGYALDIMASAGKQGGFELRDMAAEFPSITAAAQALGIKGTKGVADLVAALEVARKGASSGAEAANNMQNFMSKIVSKDTIKNFKKFGVNVPRELEKAAKAGTSPIEHMLGVIDRISKSGQPELLAQLFGDQEVQQFIRPMLANMDEYRKIRTEALAAAGTVQADFDRRMKTAGGAQLRFAAQMENLGIVIGSTLLPALTSIIDKIAPVVEAVARWAEANPELTASIVGVTAALVALRVAAFAAQFSFLWMRGGALTAALVGLKGMQAATGLLTATLGRFGRTARTAGSAAFTGFSRADQAARSAKTSAAAANAMIAGMSGASSASGIAASAANAATSARLIAGLTTAATAFTPAATGIVASIGGIFTSFAAGLAGLTAPVWIGIAAIIAAVAGLALAIYYYWDRISSWISGFMGPILAEFGKLATSVGEFGAKIGAAVGGWLIGKVVDFAALFGFDALSVRGEIDKILTTIGNFATSAVDFITGIPGRLGDWISSIFSREKLGDVAKASFDSAGEQAANALIDAVKGIPSRVVAFFATIGGDITAAFGTIDLANLIKWPTPPDWWTELTNGGPAKILQPQTAPNGQPVANAAPQFNPAAYDKAIEAARELGRLQANVASNPGFVGYFFREAGADTKIEGLKARIASMMDGLPASARAGMAAYTAEIAASGGQATAKADEIAAQIKTALSVTARPTIDLSSVNAAQGAVTRLGNSIRSLPGANAGAPAAGVAGARAAGGPIAGGRTYLVGEEGPELVTPDRSGFVHNADATRSMMGAGGAGQSSSYGGNSRSAGQVSVALGPIHIHGVNDPEVIADRLMPILNRRIRDEFSGVHADIESAVA